MMYTKDSIHKLKEDLKRNLQTWAEGKIDTLCAERPKMKYASVYLKRGLRNWIAREDARLDSMTDGVLLFVTDENGCVNTDVVIQDLVGMFKEMDVQQAHVGSFLVEYGKGELKIAIPHNPLLDLVFGDLGEVKITSEDLLEMKDLFCNKVE